jgi:hypothetical protein
MKQSVFALKGAWCDGTFNENQNSAKSRKYDVPVDASRHRHLSQLPLDSSSILIYFNPAVFNVYSSQWHNFHVILYLAFCTWYTCDKKTLQYSSPQRNTVSV